MTIFSILPRFLDKTVGFELETRGGAFVPDNFVHEGDTPPESWFLNSFKYKDCNDTDDYLTHIKTALKNLDEV